MRTEHGDALGRDERLALRCAVSAQVGVQGAGLVWGAGGQLAAFLHISVENISGKLIMTYEFDDYEGGRKVKKKESFTAFTWERTDRAAALKADAGI